MKACTILPLAGADSPERYGHKAANLSRLLAAGLPTQPGFVLGLECLDAHLEQLGLAVHARVLFADLEAGRPGDHEARAATLRCRLLDGPPPSGPMEFLAPSLEPGCRYAVRSSAPGEDGAETSFAGQFDSVLGCASAEEVGRAICRVWASLFGERAVQYMRHRRARPAGMAVLVQHQVEAALSGVMFSRDPRNPYGNTFLIEYCPGLGEALVSGHLTPGRISVNRDSGAVLVEQGPEGVSEPIADLPELGRRLKQLVGQLESLFGVPQDVEWSLDQEGQLYVLQSRPITATVAGVTWTNANIAENFPDPVVPLLRSFVGRGYAAYFRGLGRAFGISPQRMTAMAEALDNLVGCHAGRLYYNLSNIHTVIHLAPGGPWLTRYFNQFTGAREFPTPVRIESGPLARTAEIVGVALRVLWRYLHVQGGVRRFEAEVDVYADRTRSDRLADLTTEHLAGLLHGFLRIRLERWSDAALADTAAMVCYGVLGAMLRGRVGHDVNDLLKGLPGLASAVPVEKLWALSRDLRADPGLLALCSRAPAEEVLARLRAGEHPGFLAALNAYFDTWGFRSSGELMLSRPTPCEDPLPLLRLLLGYAAQDGDGPAEVSRRQAGMRRLATRQTRRELGFWRGLAFTPVLRATQGAIRLRERARMKQALLYTRLRHVGLALGEALVRRGELAHLDDVLFLEMEEAIALAEGRGAPVADLHQAIAARRAELAAAQALNPPDSFTLPSGAVWQPDAVAEADNATAHEDVLTGTGACGGRACGHAAVVLDVSEVDRIRPDQILVTRQTDPGWAAVFFMIKGLVIERGGLLSHGAIIAREYGIPAVVGVRDATRLIEDGARVCVDGDRGRVDHVDR